MVVEESSADVARAWAQTGTETHTLLVLTQLTPGRKVWINPGAESQALVERARARGLSPILACSMIGLGDGAM